MARIDIFTQSDRDGDGAFAVALIAYILLAFFVALVMTGREKDDKPATTTQETRR